MVQDNSKEPIILAIRSLNRSASEEFLSQFTAADLREYLGNLRGSSQSYQTFAADRTAEIPVAVG